MNVDRAIERAKRGKEDGFRWLFARFRDPLYRFIRGTATLDADEADEVLQETFVRAFNGLSGLRNNGSFESWLLRIARRETWRYVARNRSHTTPIESVEVVCERQERLAELEERERLLETLRKLVATIEPAQIRDTARLYYQEGPRTTGAIADELGIPHATVRKRLFLFRKKLRDELRRGLEEA